MVGHDGADGLGIGAWAAVLPSPASFRVGGRATASGIGTPALSSQPWAGLAMQLPCVSCLSHPILAASVSYPERLNAAITYFYRVFVY